MKLLLCKSQKIQKQTQFKIAFRRSETNRRCRQCNRAH